MAYREIPLARHRLHARRASHSQASIFPSLASHLRVVCTALTGLVALPSVFVVTGIFFSDREENRPTFQLLAQELADALYYLKNQEQENAQQYLV